jgi:hypothetical protein
MPITGIVSASVMRFASSTGTHSKRATSAPRYGSILPKLNPGPIRAKNIVSIKESCCADLPVGHVACADADNRDRQRFGDAFCQLYRHALQHGHIPKFAKNFLAEAGDIRAAVRQYIAEVESGAYPGLWLHRPASYGHRAGCPWWEPAQCACLPGVNDGYFLNSPRISSQKRATSAPRYGSILPKLNPGPIRAKLHMAIVQVAHGGNQRNALAFLA